MTNRLLYIWTFIVYNEKVIEYDSSSGQGVIPDRRKWKFVFLARELNSWFWWDSGADSIVWMGEGEGAAVFFCVVRKKGAYLSMGQSGVKEPLW